MGWISKRSHQTGTSIGGNPAKCRLTNRYPLRKIVYVTRMSEGLFDHDTALLECGHKGPAHGYYRARCRECWEAANPVQGCALPPKVVTPEAPRLVSPRCTVEALLSGTGLDENDAEDAFPTGFVRLSCGHEDFTSLCYRLGAVLRCRQCPKVPLPLVKEP